MCAHEVPTGVSGDVEAHVETMLTHDAGDALGQGGRAHLATTGANDHLVLCQPRCAGGVCVHQDCVAEASMQPVKFRADAVTEGVVELLQAPLDVTHRQRAAKYGAAVAHVGAHDAAMGPDRPVTHLEIIAGAVHVHEEPRDGCGDHRGATLVKTAVDLRRQGIGIAVGEPPVAGFLVMDVLYAGNAVGSEVRNAHQHREVIRGGRAAHDGDLDRGRRVGCRQR